MKSKYPIWLIGVIVVLIVAGISFVVKYSLDKQLVVFPELNNQNVAKNPSSPQPSIKPIDTNLGSVAGVNLGALGIEANESGLNSLQDGSSDASSLSSGTTFDSAIDSAANPIQ